MYFLLYPAQNNYHMFQGSSRLPFWDRDSSRLSRIFNCPQNHLIVGSFPVMLIVKSEIGKVEIFGIRDLPSEFVREVHYPSSLPSSEKALVREVRSPSSLPSISDSRRSQRSSQLAYLREHIHMCLLEQYTLRLLLRRPTVKKGVRISRNSFEWL